MSQPTSPCSRLTDALPASSRIPARRATHPPLFLAENRRPTYLRPRRLTGGNSFRSTSSSSLHLDNVAAAPRGRMSFGLRTETSSTRVSEDSGTNLTPVEVQAMGAFVPMFNHRCYDNVAPEDAAPEAASVEPGQPGGAPRHELRRKRTWMDLLRGKDAAAKEPVTQGPGMADARVNKRPSLFFRILGSASTGGCTEACEVLQTQGVGVGGGGDGATDWTRTISRKMSSLALGAPSPCAAYNPELISEVERYF